MERKRDASDQTRFSRSSSLPLAAIAVASICFFLVASCSCCPLVTKEERKILTRTDNGEVSAVDVDVDDGCNYRNSSYHLEFISMEPNSLFLPVFLHNDVVFYVQTGNGTVSWWIKKDDDVTVKETHLDVGCGDMYRIGRGSFFYILTRSDPMWNKLRISALFVNQCMQEKTDTPYSNAADLIRGFDVDLLGAGFNVSDNAVSRIIKPAEKPPPIIPYTAVAGNKSDDSKLLFNIHKKKPDIKNQHGWSSTSAVPGEESDVGGFMVNLTQGSMIAPHWNPTGSEISMVTEGEGMIQIVYPTSTSTSTSTSKTIGLFKVKVGDVFVVPRYHPMVQVSFRHSSLALVGFTTVDPHSSSNNHPQFLAGTGSVFRMLDRQVLAMGFDVGSTTVDKIFSSVDDAVLLDCISCAEEMETKMRHDIEKRQKQEEIKRMEEARQREREKQEKRRREEEERHKEEEEEEEERKERQKRQKEEEEERQKEEEEEEEEEEERKEREKRQKEEEEERREREKRQKEEESKEDEKEKAKRREEKEEESRREEEEDDKEEKEKEKRREEEGGWEGDRW